MSQEIKIEKKASDVIQPGSTEEARQAIREKKDLSGAVLSGIKLKNLTSAGAILRKTDLSGADLSHSFLIFPNFYRATLYSTAIHNTLVLGGDLVRVNFTEADLSKSALIGVEAREANFESADLHDTVLFRAHLKDANFTNANLENARLVSSDVTGADFSEANLSGARSRKTDWSKAKVPPAVIPEPMPNLPIWAWAIIAGSFVGLIALVIYAMSRKKKS